MKMFCKCLILGGAAVGMLIGASASYLTCVMLKDKMSLSQMMKCKGKKAMENMMDKFSL